MDDIKKIVIEDENGATKTVEKGFIASFDNSNEKDMVTFNMVGIKGEDLYPIVMSVLQLGDKLGYFNEEVRG